MVTSFQYPHILQVKNSQGQWEDFSICRDQPNDKGAVIQVGEGTFYQFRSIVFMALGVENLLTGQDVKVIDINGNTRLDTEVRRFSSDNLHCRLWV